MIDFSDFSDDELLRNGSAGAEDELIRRYSFLVRLCARPLFLIGGDSEDLIQEGLLGLLSAVRSYSEGGGASFSTYAERCIKNRLYSAVKSDGRASNRPLNDSLPIDAADSVRRSRELEDLVITREYTEELFSELDERLSKLEKRVLGLYLEGRSYAAIASALGIQEKSVDNAVQRIRWKLRRF